METGLAANIEIFSNGDAIFSHSANFEECDPNASAEEIVNALYEEEIMSRIDALQEEGAGVTYKVSLHTSSGDVMVDGIAYEAVPDNTEQFSKDLYTGLSSVHAQLEQQYMIPGNCTQASAADMVEPVVGGVKPI